MTNPLLLTKLFVPPPRADLVHRPSLIDRLEDGLRAGRRLTLISAPAGFGKTALISQWIAQSARPTAWLTLEETENDPVQFLRYLTTALQSLDTSLGLAVQSLLSAPQMPSTSSLLTMLINDLSLLKPSFLLVLDDLHLVASEEVFQAIQFLVNHQPPHMHTVICTRQDPPLLLAQIRARGHLTELRERDLRFSLSEVVDFFRMFSDLHLEDEDLAALEQRTEGWVAGLQLAALALQQSPQGAHAFVAGFTGSDRYVMDYLLTEVLQKQSAEVRQFLRQTSILDRLSAPLCDALTGRLDSAEVLAYLERSNLFVSPLDNQRCWYTYHSLFADVLEAGLDRDEKARLHQKAAQWYASQGFIHQSVDYALESARISGDWQLAEGLIRSTSGGLANSGVWTLRRWLEALPPEHLRQDGELSAYLGWSYALTGDLVSAQQAASNAEKILERDQAPPDQRGKIQAILSFIANLHSNNPGEAARRARHALDLLEEEQTGWRALALWVLAESLEQDYHQGQAIGVFDQVRQAGLALGNPVFTMLAESSLAASLNDLGRRREAIQVCERAIQRYPDENDRSRAMISPLLARLGTLYYDANELQNARRSFDDCLDLSRQLGLEYYEVLARGMAAPTWYAQGRTIQALEALEQARRFIERTGYSDPSWFMAWEASLRLKMESPALTLRWAETVGLNFGDLPATSRIEMLLVSCRLLLSLGKLEEAQNQVENILEFVKERGLQRWEISSLILQALIGERLGERSRGRQSLWQAVQLAAPESYLRLFLDEDEQVLSLLPGVRQAAPGFVDAALAATGLSEIQTPPAGQPPINPLSPRELEVLRLIAEGLNNKQICQRLYIAEGTLKRHINHIFRKLEASSRTQAVAKARNFGLF